MPTETTTMPNIAIVTGGSRGLGRSTVLSLAQRGVSSIFTYNSSPDEAQNVVAAAEQAGARVAALKLDIGDSSSFDGFVDSVRSTLAEWGAERFDYLVNNAGISDHTPFAQVTEELLDRMYRVNFKGVYFLTQKLLPIINDGGRIINISTAVTRLVNPNSSAYATMKGALEVLTRYLASDLGPRGITVNTVAPGPVATDFSGGVVRDNPEINKRVAAVTALGRAGVPDDIGPMIAALLSGENRWVNAQRIEVSGGMMP
ncbi:SDR family NAD(P)-dependent oxidoreductase [Deinococcus sp.]|uniref:SDR family NAD(P)-dependent oxidoreductase n=1 Tax=Deinococcus sp. TaxID=47478 RepID=UPI003B5CF79A